VAAVLAGTAAAASASAATVSVTGACYLDSQMIPITGSGFTPGAAVSYAFDGVASATGTADAGGNVSQQVAAPVLPPDTFEHVFNMTVTDQSNLSNVGTAPVRISQLTAKLTPSQARPTSRIRFAVHGMPPGQLVYLHYVYRGRARATVTLGRPSAPCGVLTVKRRFFPMRRPAVGTWIFQFDNRKRYSAGSRPAIVGKIPVFHRLHSVSAAASTLR
jgi:hypothetical protein